MEEHARTGQKTGCLGLAVGFFAGAACGIVFEFIFMSMTFLLKAGPVVIGVLAIAAVLTILIRKSGDPEFSGFAKSALIGFLIATLLMSGCYGILTFGNINFH